MSKTKKPPAVKPGENLVPKASSIWTALALVIFPMFAVLLIGRTITRAVGGGEGQLSEVVSTLAIVAFLAGGANLVWVAISITRKGICGQPRDCKYPADGTLIIVLRPATLVIKEGFKPRLNPCAIPTVDSMVGK